MLQPELLLELADRCENGSNHDQRQLLIDAFRVVNEGRFGVSAHRIERGNFIAKLDAHAFHDAVLLLLPEGSQWSFDSHYKTAEVHVYGSSDGYPVSKGYKAEGNVNSLAICAAVLRAHHNITTGAEGHDG